MKLIILSLFLAAMAEAATVWIPNPLKGSFNPGSGAITGDGNNLQADWLKYDVLSYELGAYGISFTTTDGITMAARQYILKEDTPGGLRGTVIPDDATSSYFYYGKDSSQNKTNSSS